ncbi:patatin-like phospholipase protein [Ceratobasidium sp. AG-Ba]|nr:patatin-like phospholipase protein [Ceratobasidium sp. AG-Ba]
MIRLQEALGVEEYPNVFDHFDIVAGAGTGAIIVCLVGRLRVPVRQAIKYYQRLADVFSKKRPIGGDEGAFKINKLATVMKAIVRDATGDEDTAMLDTRIDASRSKTMVFAMSKHNVNAAVPAIFRSYQGAKNQLDDCAIWEAVCASMAHPELFRSFDVGRGPLRQSYVGGTLGCGNPIEHVLVEAKALFPDRYLSSIVSIGAGHTRTIQISQPRLLNIMVSTNAEIAMKDIAKDCEAAAQRMITRFQQVPNVYFRFSVEQGMQDVKLCDWEKLGEVKAHTAAYMRRADIDARLGLAVNVVKVRIGSVHMGTIDGQVHPPPVHSAIVMLCPAPTPVFTGREDIIRRVVECLSGGDKKRCVFVLHGMGGAGKTQLALKVVERTNGMWSDLVYVDATTRETTVKALESFAQAKCIGTTHQDTLAYLSNRRERWLMLVDNADDPSLGISDYLPRGDHGSILLTSRLADMALLGRGSMSDCRMSNMKPEETLELLLKTTRMRPSELTGEEGRAANDLIKLSVNEYAP